METEIILKSNTLIVEEIIRKTSANMFKDIEVGDKLSLSVSVEYAGSNRGSTYATYIKCTNLSKNDVAYKSFNQMPTFLDFFKLKEVK